MLTEKETRKRLKSIREQRRKIEGVTKHAIFLEGKICGYKDVLEELGMEKS